MQGNSNKKDYQGRDANGRFGSGNKYGGVCTRPPLYWTWHSIKERCFNPNRKNYPRYGGRGITVCSEWLNYKTFEKWAFESGWRKGLAIDRLDNNGGYEPGNCWFLSPSLHSSKTNHKVFIRKGFVCF